MKKIKNFKNNNREILFKTLIVIFLNLMFFLIVAVIFLVKKNSLAKNTILKKTEKIKTTDKKLKLKEIQEIEEDEIQDEKNNSKKKEKNLIASYTTELSTEREKEKNRIYNIKKAASFLNNLTIKPNSEFSFKKNAWQNEKNKNYKYADTLTQNGMDKGLGGGICQVATTLYIAALKANLKITNRQPHSRIISYAPLGLDASFFTPYKDLKFINSLKTEIKIKTNFKDNKLTIKLLTKEPIKKNYDKIMIEKAKIIENTKKNIKTDVLIKIIKDDKVIETKHVKSCYEK